MSASPIEIEKNHNDCTLFEKKAPIFLIAPVEASALET